MPDPQDPNFPLGILQALGSRCEDKILQCLKALAVKAAVSTIGLEL